MGCGVTVRVLPISAQRAIKSRQDSGSFILSLSQYDSNYEWYRFTCEKLEGGALRQLTLNFDVKHEIPGIKSFCVDQYRTRLGVNDRCAVAFVANAAS